MKSLIAAAAVFVVAAVAAIIFVLNRHTGDGPDAFAGAYPLVTASPTGASAVPTWRPTGSPAGPLPAFPGRGSRVVGRTVNRVAGLSYARLGSPWHLHTRAKNDPSSGEGIDAKTKDYTRFWYASVEIAPFEGTLNVQGAQRLRAAAELSGDAFVKKLYNDGGSRKELAGAAMKVGGHSAWVTAFRMTHTTGPTLVEKNQTEVLVAVDTGRRLPAIAEVTIPGNRPNLLPDITQVVRSLRVVS